MRQSISIHAAREGGDDNVACFLHSTQAISIHAAREGGDPANSLFLGKRLFQSTPPVKAATLKQLISIRVDTISIHAAREGGDN